MRKNKKLLLGGLSVLTLVAAGSGAVSTFAWYSATTNATVTNSTANNTGELSTTQTALDVDGVTIKITLTGGSAVELTNVSGGSVYVGVGAEGGVHTEENWTNMSAEDKALHPIVSTFTASAVFDDTPDASQKAALAGKSYRFDVSANGNVVFVGTDGKTACTPKVRVDFKADGTIDDTVVEDGTYAVRTNNPNGIEAAAGAADFSTGRAYAIGEVVTYSTAVYICSAAHSAGAWSNDHFTLAVLHSTDSVSIAASAAGTLVV